MKIVNNEKEKEKPIEFAKEISKVLITGYKHISDGIHVWSIKSC